MLTRVLSALTIVKVGGLSQIVILMLRMEGGGGGGLREFLISVNRLHKHYGKARLLVSACRKFQSSGPEPFQKGRGGSVNAPHDGEITDNEGPGSWLNPLYRYEY